MRATGVEDIHSALQQTASNNYVLVASFAVYLFDRTLLSGQEASYIWRYRLSMVPALTILLHGTTILNFALLCYEQMVDLDCKRALPVNIASEVALALFDSIIALITALRVYAINNRDWRIPFLVFLLSLIRTAYDLFGTGTKTGLVLPSPLGCAVVSTSSINGSFLIGSIVCNCAADALVMIVTWRRTYRTTRLISEEDKGHTMSFLLLRDGTIYFGLLLIISILDVVIYTVNSFQGFQYLRLAFTTIILSRFFVNLREASQTTILDSVTTLSEWKPSSTLHFSLGVDAYGGTLASVQSGAMTSDIHDNDRDDDSLAIAMEPRVATSWHEGVAAIV